jgi:hypothetical protein
VNAPDVKSHEWPWLKCGMRVGVKQYVGNTLEIQAVEKIDSERILVAQALLPVRISQSAHSHEWLCYPTFSATCEACFLAGPVF